MKVESALAFTPAAIIGEAKVCGGAVAAAEWLRGRAHAAHAPDPGSGPRSGAASG
jgi:hypothetical protein